VTNINLYSFAGGVPCGVSLSTFELIPAVATAQPGALVTVVHRLILTFLFFLPTLLTIRRSLRPMFYVYCSVAICQLIFTRTYGWMDMDMARYVLIVA